jgi:hypothetical protein
VICIAPTQPFLAALGAESRLCYPGNTADRQTQRGALTYYHRSLAVNSKSERNVNSLPQLGFEPVIIGMLAHLSNHSAKSHPPSPTYETNWPVWTCAYVNVLTMRIMTMTASPEPIRCVALNSLYFIRLIYCTNKATITGQLIHWKWGCQMNVLLQ